MPSKWIMLTRSFQGPLIMLAPVIARYVGWDWTDDTAEAWEELVAGAIMLAGLIWGFIGTLYRKSAVTLLPGGTGNGG